MVQGNKETIWGFFYKSTNLIHEATALITSSLPNGPLPPSQWGLVSTYEFWGDMNIQSIAPYKQKKNLWIPL